MTSPEAASTMEETATEGLEVLKMNDDTEEVVEVRLHFVYRVVGWMEPSMELLNAVIVALRVQNSKTYTGRLHKYRLVWTLPTMTRELCQRRT